jgi:hypothetical protein
MALSTMARMWSTVQIALRRKASTRMKTGANWYAALGTKVC